VLDPQAVLSGQTRRGASGGVVAVITVSSVCLGLFLGLWLLVGGLSFFVAALLSMVTLVPMMAFVMALDSLEPEPRYLLVATFLWGAGATVALSLILEAAGGLTLSAFGAASDTRLAVFVAPVVEESTKALAVFGLFWFRRNQLNGITDGVVYAATSALGFAAAENVEYYIAAAMDGGAAEMGAIFVLRGVVSPFCHPVFTAMTGIAVALAVRQRGAARVLLPIAGLLAAMLLHGMWNGLAVTGLGGIAVAMLIVVSVLVAILIALSRDRRRTIAQIDTCMRAYVPTGLVTATDLAMLSTLALRKQARVWARSTRGITGFNAMRDYQQACTKLTMLHDRAQIGLVSPLDFERQRWALLTLMRFAREAFLGTTHLAVPMVSAPWAQRYVPQQQYVQPVQPVQPVAPVAPSGPGPQFLPPTHPLPQYAPSTSAGQWAPGPNR